MRWRDRTLAVLAAAGTLLAGTLVSGSPAWASAGKPRCDAGDVVIKNRDGGWGVMKGSFNLKRQPYQHCANVRRLHKGQVLYFHCWVRNRYGKWWAYGPAQGDEHVRLDGPGTTSFSPSPPRGRPARRGIRTCVSPIEPVEKASRERRLPT
jgi:hypothetical protein